MLLRRTPLATGISVAVIGGYLLLPEGVQIQPVNGLPPFDKDLSAAIASLLLVALGDRDTHTEQLGWLPKEPWVLWCGLGLFSGLIATGFANTDPLVFGPVTLPAIQPKHIVTGLMVQCAVLLPFLVGRKFLATPDGQERLLAVVAGSALLYCLPALLEIRLSPQLSNWIYGFFPHFFDQHIRGEGFRPVVFLHHGLWLGLFLLLGYLAQLSRALRASSDQRVIRLGGAVVLLTVLVLAKNFGPLLLAVAFTPVIMFTPRFRLLAAAVIAAAVLAYPALRSGSVIPTERFAVFAESIDAERAASFRFRLRQEDALMARSAEKPVFGWGVWGRARVHDANGRDMSVTDGLWLLVLGEGGWVRYLSLFGLLSIPLGLAWWNAARFGLDDTTATITVLLAVNLVDLIPNATLTPVTWLLAGSLVGRLELSRSRSARGGGSNARAPIALRYAPTHQERGTSPYSLPTTNDASPYSCKGRP